MSNSEKGQLYFLLNYIKNKTSLSHADWHSIQSGLLHLTQESLQIHSSRIIDPLGEDE